MQSFLAAYVSPILSINVADTNAELRTMSHQLTAHLAGGNLSEMASLSAKLARALCEGRFQQKPATLGMMAQCLDLVGREERGVQSLKKTRKMGDVEKRFVQEAGSLLALNGCGEDAMRELGFSKIAVWRSETRVDQLLSQGLPCPGLALLWPDILSQNAACIDSLAVRAEHQTPRRFVLCMDATYLLKHQTQMRLHGEQAIVGGPFTMADLAGSAESCGSFQRLQHGKINLTEKQKANRMPLA